MRRTSLVCIITFFALIAACDQAPTVVEIPTLASLPTLTDTVPPPTGTLTPTAVPPTAVLVTVGALPTITPVPSLTAAAVVNAPTITPVPSLTPTATGTLTLTPTEGPSLTPSMTITNTPTLTLTPTVRPTEDNDAISSLLQLAMQATILPQAMAQQIASLPAPLIGTPGSLSCTYPVPPGFGDFFASDADFSAQIGCPVGAPPSPQRISGASQRYEHGVMVYVGDPQRAIYAIFDNGQYRRFPDSWVEGVDPSSGGETPPSGLIEPIRGFGKVWRTNPDVRAALGWARAPEQGEDLSLLSFDRGQVFSPPNVGRVYALADSGTGTGGVWRGS